MNTYCILGTWEYSTKKIKTNKQTKNQNNPILRNLYSGCSRMGRCTMHNISRMYNVLNGGKRIENAGNRLGVG